MPCSAPAVSTSPEPGQTPLSRLDKSYRGTPEALPKTTALLYAPAYGLVTPEQVAEYGPHCERVVELPGMHSVFTTAFDETVKAVSDFLRETESSK